MTGIPDKIQTWQMVQPTTYKKDENGKFVKDAPGKLEQTTIPVPEVGRGRCSGGGRGLRRMSHRFGLFLRRRAHGECKPPLTLGHEISGTVVAAGPDEPGGQERDRACGHALQRPRLPHLRQGPGQPLPQVQKMPGNSLGMYGGFSSHIPVPAERSVPHRRGSSSPCPTTRWWPTRPPPPIRRPRAPDIKEGDLVVITGAAGGVGVYMVQIAKALGAKVVVGIDVNQAKLDRAPSNTGLTM